MKIWLCFGSYLCWNIERSKGFTNFQAALYIFVCVCVFMKRQTGYSYVKEYINNQTEVNPNIYCSYKSAYIEVNQNIYTF